MAHLGYARAHRFKGRCEVLRLTSPIPPHPPKRTRCSAARHHLTARPMAAAVCWRTDTVLPANRSSEFALLLPVLLALVGVTVDFARVYQAWTDLESATRDAAQYLTISNVDTTAVDYTVPDATGNISNDNIKVKPILDSETGANFTRSGTELP